MNTRKNGNTMSPQKIYTAYSPKEDITFILEDTKNNSRNLTTEVKGFYFGVPDDELAKEYYGKLKAEYW